MAFNDVATPVGSPFYGRDPTTVNQSLAPLLSPGETQAQWAASNDANARTTAAGGWNQFLNGIESTTAGVGLMGAMVAAPMMGTAIGGLGGAAAAGGLAGAAGTTGMDRITGAPVTLGSVGKGALMGAAGGALGYGLGPNGFNLSGNLTSSGVPAPISSGATSVADRAAMGLLGNSVNSMFGGSGAASGQGNGTSMGNIDTSLASTIGGGGGGASAGTPSLGQSLMTALPGVLQAGAGVYGSQNAAQAMTGADANAIGTQQSTLGNINNIWSTQQQLGQGAQTSLGSALGTNGQPANYSNFMNMPGYQFAVQQGTQAINRQAAAMGSAYTPNTSAAVGQYVTGTAMNDYNTYINQLMGAAGLGSTANTGIATPTYNTGANISTLQQNQGYAQASGVSGASNAVGGFLSPGGAGSSLIGAAGNYLFGGNNGASAGIPSLNAGNYNPTSNTQQTSAALPTDMSGINPNNPVASSPYFQANNSGPVMTDPNITSGFTSPSPVDVSGTSLNVGVPGAGSGGSFGSFLGSFGGGG